jgi:hypothetical protein
MNSKITIESSNFDDFSSLKSLGASLRTPTKGPEYLMVKEYIRKIYEDSAFHSSVIFLEPRIEVSSPDIVIVCLSEKCLLSKPFKEKKLQKNDLRVLHYIFSQETVSSVQVNKIFPRSVNQSLRRLGDSGLIKYELDGWVSENLENIFAIQNLITIEAKMTNWREGLRQAFHNTWFATESYLLLPKQNHAEEILSEASKLGVGILAADSPVCFQNSSSKCPPKSYVSWIFNEWAWAAWSDFSSSTQD